jgi:hypothetical protein
MRYLSTKDRVNGGGWKGRSGVTYPDTQPFGVLQRIRKGRGQHVWKILNYLQ